MCPLYINIYIYTYFQRNICLKLTFVADVSTLFYYNLVAIHLSCGLSVSILVPLFSNFKSLSMTPGQKSTHTHHLKSPSLNLQMWYHFMVLKVDLCRTFSIHYLNNPVFIPWSPPARGTLYAHANSRERTERTLLGFKSIKLHILFMSIIQIWKKLPNRRRFNFNYIV